MENAWRAPQVLHKSYRTDPSRLTNLITSRLQNPKLTDRSTYIPSNTM